MNELLLWMSARGEGGMGSFRAKATELWEGRRSGPAPHYLSEWNLSILGHAEFGVAAAKGWRIAPPVLAADDLCGPYRAILCGARTPKLIRRLQDAAGDHLKMLPQAEGPDLIELAAESAAELLTVEKVASVPLQWNAPLAVLGACVPPREQVLAPVVMPTGAWTVSRFSKSQLKWIPSTLQEARNQPAGLFRFKSDQGTEHVLKAAGEVLGTDPAVGKYRILKRRSRALGYDARSSVLSVPVTCRPPMLAERALVISCGKLPTIQDGRILYHTVRREVAEAFASLLSQRLN